MHLDFGLKRSACSIPLLPKAQPVTMGEAGPRAPAGSAPSYPHSRDYCQHSLLSFQITPTPALIPTQTEKACVRLRLAPLRQAIHTVLTGLQWTPTGGQTEEQVSEIMPPEPHTQNWQCWLSTAELAPEETEYPAFSHFCPEDLSL